MDMLKKDEKKKNILDIYMDECMQDDEGMTEKMYFYHITLHSYLFSINTHNFYHFL